MKNVLMLCVLVALCALQFVQGDRLPELQSQLDGLKNDVEETMRDMERYEHSVMRDVNMNLRNVKVNYLRQMNDITNPLRNEIGRKVDAAKAEGKDAHHCREEGRRTLQDYRQDAYRSVAACGAQSRRMMEPIINRAQAVVQTGHKLLSELDNIPATCYSDNSQRMENCIARQLTSVKPAVRALSSSAESVKTSGQATVSRSTQQADTCSAMAVMKLRSKAPTVMPTVEECIRNA